MRKILFILNNLIIGGVEKVCWEIVSNMDFLEFQCDFLVAISNDCTQYYEQKLKELGCRIYKGGYIYNQHDKKKFLEIERNLLRQNRYDIVHSHLDFLNIWTLRVAQLEKVTCRISHVHTIIPYTAHAGLFKKIKYCIQQKLLVYYSTHRLACSEHAALAYYGNANSKVIFNGFDISAFMSHSMVKREKWSIITVGRIVDQKNPIFIIEIMYWLTKFNPEYKLYWVGDGNMRALCENKIKELGLNSYIEMIGAETEIIPILQKNSIALFPSKTEGLGIAIVEAQLAGCFTYYSDVVPQEADIGYSCALSLNQSPREWAERIHHDAEENKFKCYRLDMERALRFDVNHLKKSMEFIYNGK